MASKLVAITFGCDRDSERVRRTAESLQAHTGLDVTVLGDGEYASSAAARAGLLRYRLFDFVDADDALVLEPGFVCLRSWDPHELLGYRGIVCVRDDPNDSVLEDCREWGLKVEDYFHAGFLLINRARHTEWLRLAEKIALWRRQLRRHEQTALNVARVILQTPLSFVDRRFNWIGYGKGSLCRRLPIFGASGAVELPDPPIRPDGDGDKGFDDAVPNALIWDAVLQKQLGGRVYSRRRMGRPAGRLFLREDGTVIPEGLDGERYWFAYWAGSRAGLALTTNQEVVRTLALQEDGIWSGGCDATPEQMKTLPDHSSVDLTTLQTPEEAEVAARIVRQRAFQYIRVGLDERRMELLDGGEIGAGRGGCEERWFVVRRGTTVELALSGRDGIICRLSEGANGWRGRWLKYERMPVEMKPIDSVHDASADCTDIRNEHEFQVIAMRRSGHHALIRWLAGHFREGAHHFNDVPAFADPIDNHRGYFRLFGADCSMSVARQNAEQLRREPKTCLIVNREDWDLSRLANGQAALCLDGSMGKSRGTRRLLCLRDPYNMLASLYAMERDTVLRYYADLLTRWKQHALEFAGHTTFLREKVLINHNVWSVSSEYRKTISAELNLEFNDRGFQVLPYRALGGSSFQKSDIEGSRPEQRGLLDRWRHFENDPYFPQFFRAVPDLRDITSQIFGSVGPDW